MLGLKPIRVGERVPLLGTYDQYVIKNILSHIILTNDVNNTQTGVCGIIFLRLKPNRIAPGVSWIS